MKIFAIESSCDETAAAIVENGVNEISSVVASSANLHEETGGVVPEVAARKQLEFVVPVIDKTLANANLSFSDIDALAVTIGPGLVGSLFVGIEASKTLSAVLNKPLIPVNHLVGHIYANFVEFQNQIEFPALVLIVSGGHTDLLIMRDHGDFEYLGGTLDDAVGEAFDKTARLLGISKYLGGAKLSKLSAECKTNIYQGILPRPLINEPHYDFSFSGLKTFVRNFISKNPGLDVPSFACEFETACVDVLVAKTIKAATHHNIKNILIAGGVAANTHLRSRMVFEAENLGIPVFVPSSRLCTDNAVYIASAAFFNYFPRTLDKIFARPSLGIAETL